MFLKIGQFHPTSYPILKSIFLMPFSSIPFACLLSFCLGRNRYLEIGIVARGRNRCLGIESLTISGDGIVNDIGRGGGGNWDKIVVVLDWYYRHFPLK